MFKKLIIFLFLSVFMLTCDDTNPFLTEPDFSEVPAAFPRDPAKKTVRENGLIIYEVTEGYGNFVVNNRDVINGFYTGRLTSGKVFDSSYSNGNKNYTVLSIGGINSRTGDFIFVEGFRHGFVGMKQGGKRVIVIPPNLGYGDFPSSEFQNDTLVFDIEVHSFVAGKVVGN